MAELLRQVLLTRRVPHYVDGLGGELAHESERRDVFWIDAELAKVGKRVRDEDGRVWTVAEVYNAKPFTDIEKQRAAWKRWAEVLGG